MKYMGWSIGDIMDDQGWIGYLKRDGIASVDLGREFYAALLDVEDIEALLWTVTVHRVTFQLSPDILAHLWGCRGRLEHTLLWRWEQARCGRHLPYFHGPGHGASDPSSDRSSCSLSGVFYTSSSPTTLSRWLTLQSALF
ncbi:hypothetical protein CJ030_MR7G027999 [Morella rubra]|uniref:Uncharacterized protein n=1 Tax=Morella rubra TaxID=262757 RepID=A0A6A1V0G5_9ROSI|nr:hypothetical protein CJ030_MR7G027999 [Morella rubra]